MHPGPTLPLSWIWQHLWIGTQARTPDLRSLVSTLPHWPCPWPSSHRILSIHSTHDQGAPRTSQGPMQAWGSEQQADLPRHLAHFNSSPVPLGRGESPSTHSKLATPGVNSPLWIPAPSQHSSHLDQLPKVCAMLMLTPSFEPLPSALPSTSHTIPSPLPHSTFTLLSGGLPVPSMGYKL